MSFSERTAAFIYCKVPQTATKHVEPHVTSTREERWALLATFLQASDIPGIRVGTFGDIQGLSPWPEFPTFQGIAASRQELFQRLPKLALDQRNCVLIVGCYAEALITDVALATLEEGYDTYVTWDRVWALTQAGLEAAKARLLQAGAVPTCVDQVLHRWS